jgi:zinc protease
VVVAGRPGLTGTIWAPQSSENRMVQFPIMRKILLSACLVTLAAGPSPAQGTSASFSVPIVYRKLPNGLRVVVSENHASPTVIVEVMYRIGFRIEPKDRTGFAHLFEHMMFQGSEHVGKFEHVRIVNENGGVLNGSTRFDHTNYFEVMPSNALELAMWLEADRMRSLKITPENLKNQQNVVSEEVRVNVLNQPYGAFEWLGLPQKANTNWYNSHNFYGDLSDIEAATLDDVKKFFDTYYAPNNAVLVVAGDAAPDDVLKLAQKHFGGIPSRQVPPPPDISEPPQTAERTFAESDKLARTPAVAFGYHLPPRMSRDFFALALLDPLLVGDESARLYQVLIKDQQIASAVSGGFNYGLGNDFDYNGPMLYTFRVDYRPTLKGADVMKAVDDVIGAIQTQGITEDQLKQAKVNFRSGFFETIEGGGTPLFGRSDLLAAFALYDDDPNRINTILGDLDKVTAADVQAAAKKYLVPANRTSIDRRPAAAAGGDR